jgi:glycosyltransferase involved in cell wall biosynthesis
MITPRLKPPTISAVVAAYQSQETIREALDSVLNQSHPPDEVVVVDDGSTDATPDILASYRDDITVVRQDNAGYPAAMNRAIATSRGDVVAPIGADDIWLPDKLAWQHEALERHPDVGVHFGHAHFFGRVFGDHPRPRDSGLLDNARLWDDLYAINVINTPGVAIDRRLFSRVGWFADRFLADDYQFFFDAMRAGIRFYYEPRTMVLYRQHEHNITNNDVELREAMVLVRRANADRVTDPDLVSRMLAPDLYKIARRRVDEGRKDEARAAFREALEHRRGAPRSANARARVWLGLLALPDGVRSGITRGAVGASRAVDAVKGGRSPVLP